MVNTKSYKIHSGNHKFLALIVYDSVHGETKITFGGKKTSVHITVYNESDFEQDDPEQFLAHLQGISYNQECTLKHDLNLERKHGTIEMVKAALTFLFKKYPHLKGITFKDTSIMKCLHMIQINLSEFFIAKYGITWYQEKFNALPFNNPNYHEHLSSLNTAITSSKLPFKEFYTKYVKPNRIPVKYWTVKTKTIYESSNNYRDFVKKLHNGNNDCSIFVYWLHSLMVDMGINKLNLQEMFFVISRGNVENWNTEFEIHSI
jgi:hypothetical protein